jgi:hypothetical protein
MLRKSLTLVGMTCLLASTLPADFSYQETSTVTGGAMLSLLKIAGVFSKQAREPIKSTVAVKGDRMANRSATHASIIDLSSQTITNIDLQKKTYSVMTFDQMKQMLEQASQKMQKGNDKTEVNWKVSAKATGNTRQISGFDAKEMLITMEMEGTDKESGQKGSMVINMNSWIAPAVPGYAEARDFYKRMAEKLNWTPGGNMFMSRPDVAKGMAEVYKEMSKLDGTPVFQTMTMGAAGTPPPDGSAQPAAQQQQPPQPQQQQDKPSLGGALGGALGGRFGLGRKKSQSQDSQQQQQSAPANSGSSAPGSLLEMSTEFSNFSTSAADDSLFSIPAGFKKVEFDSRRMQ